MNDWFFGKKDFPKSVTLEVVENAKRKKKELEDRLVQTVGHTKRAWIEKQIEEQERIIVNWEWTGGNNGE